MCALVSTCDNITVVTLLSGLYANLKDEQINQTTLEIILLTWSVMLKTKRQKANRCYLTLLLSRQNVTQTKVTLIKVNFKKLSQPHGFQIVGKLN